LQRRLFNRPEKDYTMSQASNKNRRIHTPPTEHIGYNVTKKPSGEEQDLSGQLPKVLVGHPRHAGRSHEESEHLIKSERDSSKALNKALPIIADSSADRDGSEFQARRSGTLDGKAPKREAPFTPRAGRRK
jgi:hypothetical protein